MNDEDHRQLRQLTSQQRKELAREKAKELREIRREVLAEGLRENRSRIFLAVERFIIVVVSMACFTVHCISAPSSGSPKDNSFMDRGLEPMAFGGDMLLQTGLLVAFSAFIFVNVIMMLTLDILGALLLILVFFISWPESFGGLPLALFILVLLDIILHLVMLGQDIYNMRTQQISQRETPSTWVSPGRTSIDIRKGSRRSTFDDSWDVPGVYGFEPDLEEPYSDSSVRFPDEAGRGRTSDGKPSSLRDRKSTAATISSESGSDERPRKKKFSLLGTARERLGSKQEKASRPKKSLISLARERDLPSSQRISKSSQTPSAPKSSLDTYKPYPKTTPTSKGSVANTQKVSVKLDTSTATGKEKLSKADTSQPSTSADRQHSVDQRKQSVTSTGSRKQSASHPSSTVEIRKTTLKGETPRTSTADDRKRSSDQPKRHRSSTGEVLSSKETSSSSDDKSGRFSSSQRDSVNRRR